ncbi:MAG: transaldolase family protein [Candidatus Brocadiales bacterium]
MSRPQDLRTKITLDSGDPEETKEAISLLGFLDGQTTNPTLVSRNPRAEERLERDEKFTPEELTDFYRQIVRKISALIPGDGHLSIEVYADHSTTAEEMLREGREKSSWNPNAHIKYPTTREGLRAAQMSIKEGMRANLTICFTQEQAAAVYAATRGAGKGQVLVSPYVGRRDDHGENGMDLIKNIIAMYKKGDGHVGVLTASVRSVDQVLYSIALGADVVTAHLRTLRKWREKGMPVPDNNYSYDPKGLKAIPYKEIDLTKDWQEYNIAHELTEAGVRRFSEDWNKLIKQTP